MDPDSKPASEGDRTLGPEIERHLAEPAEKMDEASAKGGQAKQHDEVPTEPGVSTEQQPT